MKTSLRSPMGGSEGISDWTFVDQGIGNRGINGGQRLGLSVIVGEVGLWG